MKTFITYFVAIILVGQILNIKDYDPPIVINRKHMQEVWLRKITVLVTLPGKAPTKYRLYETLDTEHVYDYKKGESVKWDVELFGDKQVRGCVEDMNP